MFRTQDLAFYRVNPPIHKLISGVPVDLAFKPQLGYIAYPSLTSITVGSQLGDRLISLNRHSYHRFFVLGRLVRIPLVLLAGIVMAVGLAEPLRRAGQMSAIMWFTSPLVLGHGSLIMPDALSGTAAAVLLITTLRWLRRPDITNVIASGLAWVHRSASNSPFAPYY